MEEILTIPEVARFLKLSRSKAYYLVQRKQIPHIKIGKNVRVRKSELEKWLQSRTVQSN